MLRNIIVTHPGFADFGGVLTNCDDDDDDDTLRKEPDCEIEEAADAALRKLLLTAGERTLLLTAGTSAGAFRKEPEDATFDKAVTAFITSALYMCDRERGQRVQNGRGSLCFGRTQLPTTNTDCECCATGCACIA